MTIWGTSLFHSVLCHIVPPFSCGGGGFGASNAGLSTTRPGPVSLFPGPRRRLLFTHATAQFITRDMAWRTGGFVMPVQLEGPLLFVARSSMVVQGRVRGSRLKLHDCCDLDVHILFPWRQTGSMVSVMYSNSGGTHRRERGEEPITNRESLSH